MHVALGESILRQLSLLPAVVAAILARQPLSYLYGNIAADIVFAKRMSRTKQFCHHWSTAFSLLEASANDQDRSFAFGYLSHLAADTVAHGQFVPRQILMSGARMGTGHLFWELRADQSKPDHIWSRLNQLSNEQHERHHDTLAKHMTDTLFAYPINRMLFKRINSVASRRTFRRAIKFCSHHSRWYLSQKLLNEYEGESIDRIVSVLSQGRSSPVIKEDPNGTSSLMRLCAQRRYLRRRRLTGGPVAKRRIEAANAFNPAPIPQDRPTDQTAATL